MRSGWLPVLFFIISENVVIGVPFSLVDFDSYMLTNVQHHEAGGARTLIPGRQPRSRHLHILSALAAEQIEVRKMLSLQHLTLSWAAHLLWLRPPLEAKLRRATLCDIKP